jgi:LacI family transcriptional regulator
MSIDAQPPGWLPAWRGDGIIARIETPELVRLLKRLKLPTVDLRCWRKIPQIPWFETDDREVVRLAVDHLRERGLRHFAFCGFSGANYSVRRRDFFCEILAEHGIAPNIYESPGPQRPTTTGAEMLGMLDEQGVAQWLETLPQPTGLLASNDIRAQQVLIACQTAGIRVPDEIAVIGVDNDDVICPLCDPPLSSVEPDTERLGYLAAAMLDRMLAGETPPEETTFVAPRRIVARRSTELWAIDDEPASRAYQFIRDSVDSGINVDDVARAAGLSRRVLERRMHQYFDKTPHELIAQFRMRRLRQLLEDTDLPLFEIAPLAGFTHVEHMSLFFKQHEGVPPGRYRTQQRGVRR